MSHRTRALDLDSLTTEVARFLDDVPVAETTGAKLSRLLRAFLETEVLPQAERAADLGLDPAPLLEVVADVLRLYAVTLEERGPAAEITHEGEDAHLGELQDALEVSSRAEGSTRSRLDEMSEQG
jgi:hypothetical protein